MQNLVFEEGSDEGNDPSQWELTPEWLKRWETLCVRFEAKAKVLGGSSVRDGLAITLTPPSPGQAEIRVACLERQAALVEVSGVKFPRIWELDDDHKGADLESAVYTLMEQDTMMETIIWPADSPRTPGTSVVSTGQRWLAWSRD